MRMMLDLCKVRPDQAGSAGVFWLFPETIHRRLSQAYMELGIDTGSTNVRTNAGLITQTLNDAGRRVMAFDGIPIITSDYLTKEGANTGVSGTVYRTQPSGGTQYSVFLIRPGQTEDGGLSPPCSVVQVDLENSWSMRASRRWRTTTQAWSA